MKCEVCKREIKKTLLDKAVGTVIYDEKGKKHWICNQCQSQYKKEEILKIIGSKWNIYKDFQLPLLKWQSAQEDQEGNQDICWRRK